MSNLLLSEGSSMSCGLARPRSLAGGKPSQVALAMESSLAGALATGGLMHRHERR